jgi:hypothetical protein
MNSHHLELTVEKTQLMASIGGFEERNDEEEQALSG